MKSGAGIWGILMLGLWIFGGCHSPKVALDQDEFTALLLDMHRIDGTLAVEKGIGRTQELKNYAYYNDLFRKYGITRADFDSCMYYYSAQNKLFAGLYDVVIDSLNRQLTGIDKVLNELKANDSVNYFPLQDTLLLDSIYTVVIDSIVPGLYKFSTTLRFDTVDRQMRREIRSYFLSPHGNTDTLKVRDIYVTADTLPRSYNWSQYVDSLYSRLVISYLVPQDKKKTPSLPGNGKNKRPQEKPLPLEELGGKSWGNHLFRPYISPGTEQRLKQGLGLHRENRKKQ